MLSTFGINVDSGLSGKEDRDRVRQQFTDEMTHMNMGTNGFFVQFTKQI